MYPSRPQSATEKLRLHWSYKKIENQWQMQKNPQLKSCGSIEAMSSISLPVVFPINPQLKSCGSIEADSITAAIFCFLLNPQLKSCGSIEAISTQQEVLQITSIRNWKVAAPLKPMVSIRLIPFITPIRNWKVAAPLKQNLVFWIQQYLDQQSATEKLRLHWSSGMAGAMTAVRPTIRNWKVAAPLKRDWVPRGLAAPKYNPQLKSCGSIEASSSPLCAYANLPNPQLKSCGSIEARLSSSGLSGSEVQSATEKLRLHWSVLFAVVCICQFAQSATEKLRLHWSLILRFLQLILTASNPQLKSCGSIEAGSGGYDEDNLKVQSATEKLRLHWSFIGCWYRQLSLSHQSATEKLRLHWSAKKLSIS